MTSGKGDWEYLELYHYGFFKCNGCSTPSWLDQDLPLKSHQNSTAYSDYNNEYTSILLLSKNLHMNKIGFIINPSSLGILNMLIHQSVVLLHNSPHQDSIL